MVADVIGASEVPGAQLLNSVNWEKGRINARAIGVNVFHQDDRGLMWLGTDAGLYSFDGFRTKRIAFPAETLNPEVYDIREYDGKLYLGTNSGLYILDYWAEEYLPTGCKTPDAVHALALDGDALWIGSYYGLYRYDLKQRKLTDYTAKLPHRAVSSIYADGRGSLYVATFDGLLKMDTRNGATQDIPVGRNEKVTVLVPESDGRLWVGTDHGLYSYDSATGDVKPQMPGGGASVTSLLVMKTGDLLVGTPQGLLYSTDGGSRWFSHDSRRPGSIDNDIINTVLIDKQNIVWVGSPIGFSRAGIDPLVTRHSLGDLTGSGQGNQIYNILRDSGGDLWLGGTNGILHFDQGGKAHWHGGMRNSNPLSSSRVRNLYETDENELWLGGDAGIYRYDRARRVFEPLELTDRDGNPLTCRIYSMVEDRQHTLWLGAFMEGLFDVPRESRRVNVSLAVEPYRGVDVPFVSELICDGCNNKWILQERDSMMLRVDGDTGRLSRINVKKVLGELPSGLVADRHDNIWVGAHRGLAVFNSEGRLLRSIQFPLSFPWSEGVLAMACVGNSVVVSCEDGVWAVDIDTGDMRLLPLPKNSYTSIYYDRALNKVWLGSIDEVVALEPDLLSRRRSSSPIQIVGIVADGKPVELPLCQMNALKEVRVSYDNPVVDISLSTFDYTPELPARFAYRIDNAPRPTVLPLGVNTVTLSGLSRGSHMVELSVVGADTEPHVLTVYVSSPWWLSWWFILIMALLIGGAIAWIVIIGRRRRRARKQEHERMNALRNAVDRMAFVSTIGHEIKTPLSLVIGPLSRVLANPDDPANHNHLAMAYSNALRVNDLVDSTLKASRDDNDVTPPRLETACVDLVVFCRTIYDNHRQAFPEKQFSFSAPEDGLTICADPVKLESVINNLLNNACKYGDFAGTVNVEVVHEGDQAIIRVSNSGDRIPSEEMPLLFKRMYRSPRTGADVDGSGLGLAIAKEYVELHGGTINVANTSDGVTFSVCLPIVQPESHPQPSPPQRAGHMPGILVADDNASIASFVKSILEPDYEVAVVGSGQAALAMAPSFMPSLVIIDEMMPGLTGLETIRRMKQIPALAPVPVIMLTARGDAATERESVSVGINLFMTKPFDASLLRARVDQIITTRTEDMRRGRLWADAHLDTVETGAPQSGKQLGRLADVIEKNISDPDLNVAIMADKAGIHPKQLYRLIKKEYRMTPVEYLRKMRLQRAAEMLRQGGGVSVSEAMYAVGFTSPSYFSKCFRGEYGCSPGQYCTK